MNPTRRDSLAAAAAGMTVEADTLTLSDVEAAARSRPRGPCEARGEVVVLPRGHHDGLAQGPAAEAPRALRCPLRRDDGGVGEPPKRRMGWRFMAAAFVIVSSMAAATAVSFLLFLSDIAEGLNDCGSWPRRAQQLDTVEGGAPQTILILGSDKRETTEGDPGRSDTAMLLRVDPDKDNRSSPSCRCRATSRCRSRATARTSSTPPTPTESRRTRLERPRALAIKTIKEYLESRYQPRRERRLRRLPRGRQRDRLRLHRRRPPLLALERGPLRRASSTPRSTSQAGYQKLCGFKALQYVRYRHEDNDLVRGARQQDFMREARQRIPPAELLPVLRPRRRVHRHLHGEHVVGHRRRGDDRRDAEDVRCGPRTRRSARFRSASSQADGGVAGDRGEVEVARQPVPRQRPRQRPSRGAGRSRSR